MNEPLVNFNSKRFRIYPLIILITTWSIVAINFCTHSGWQGGFGQIIGQDFISFYSAGLLYRYDIEHLYNFEIQQQTQQALVDDTQLAGVDPFISPPYVALAYSPFTLLPLQYSFIIWSLLSLLLIAFTIPLLLRLVPEQSKEINIPWLRLLVIILSFFPLVLGWQVGQNHSLTLLLITSILLSSLKNKPVLAGALAGFLIYKPQFVIGFLIIWLVWREFRALFSFCCVVVIWVAIAIIQNGISSFQQYAQLSNVLLNLPFVEGFPGYLQVTLYGLLTTIFPISIAPKLFNLAYPIMLFFAICLAIVAYLYRKRPLSERVPVLFLAVLYPLIATPHALVHDLIILVPIFILWSQKPTLRYFYFVLLLFYFGGLLLPTISYILQVAIMAVIPIGVLIGIISEYKIMSFRLPEFNRS